MKDLIAVVTVVALAIFGAKSCAESEWFQRKKQEADELQRSRQTPHVIREADGCKVYAFESGGRFHYFTRCPESRTTTESTWEECRMVGKVQTCDQKSETIEVTR